MSKALTANELRGRRKVMQGVVVSDKMDKTIVVLVEDRVKHPLYGKVMTKSSRIKVHDEDNTAGIGDRVHVMEPRPLSQRLRGDSRWRRKTQVSRPGHSMNRSYDRVSFVIPIAFFAREPVWFT